MSDQLLTKCPHCATTFRLSQQQLDIAGGAVRCGACYQVFHASEHIVKTAVVEETIEAPQEAPDPFQEFEQPTASEQNGDDPYAVEQWELDNHPDADLFANNYHEKVEEDENQLSDFGYTTEDAPKKEGNQDEAWAEKLLEELGEDMDDDDDEVPDLIQDNPEKDNAQNSNTGFGGISSSDSAFSDELETTDDNPEGGSELSHSFTELDNWNSEDPFAINEEEPSLGGGAVDESWAKTMLSELEEENNPTPNLDHLEILRDEPEDEYDPFSSKDLSREIPAVKRKIKQPTKKQKSSNGAIDNALSDSASNDQPDTPKDDRLFESEDFFSQLSPEHDIDDIELGEMPELIEDDESFPADDPLTPDTQDIMDHQIAASVAHFGIEDEPAASSSAFKTAILILLNILALSALCGQYLYFQFDDLARNETYRPWFGLFCDKVGCELPLKSDVSQIRGTNLVVRTHALERNALVIDAIVYNRAKFSQPFPIIELRFDDINGAAVASRRFKPSEYIHDQQINLHDMPSDTPVHLTLEIVDPGQKAVNYQMNFFPAELPAS